MGRGAGWGDRFWFWFGWIGRFWFGWIGRLDTGVINNRVVVGQRHRTTNRE
jgi:hypothetical protein